MQLHKDRYTYYDLYASGRSGGKGWFRARYRVAYDRKKNRYLWKFQYRIRGWGGHMNGVTTDAPVYISQVVEMANRGHEIPEDFVVQATKYRFDGRDARLVNDLF